MREIKNRQYKLNQIRDRRFSKKSSVKVKKGKRGDSRLDRRDK
jgi:hypothetical protein